MLKIAFIIFLIIYSLIGLFLVFRPNQAIKLQQVFYAKINWRIEPIIYSKEIRNTRLMGIMVLVLIIFSLIFFLKNI